MEISPETAKSDIITNLVPLAGPAVHQRVGFSRKNGLN